MTAISALCCDSKPPIDVMSRVSRILGQYLSARACGEAVNVEALAARDPDLGDLLRRYVAKLEALHATALAGQPPADAQSGERGRLGDFQIGREIGRGAWAVVYQAEQTSLGRRVALKVLPFVAALDAGQLQRFKREALAAVQLHHSHIAPVHDVGCDRGVHYYAMQFIEGQTLATFMKEMRRLSGPDAAPVASRRAASPLGPEDTARSADYPTAPATMRSTRDPAFFRTAAQLGVQAAEALEYAHHLGVIHRDIKPANLFLDARAHLWIADFGLARCHFDSGPSMIGESLDSLRCMSPEQALTWKLRVDHRTDVYSLGATLYELLTSVPAHAFRDRTELLRAIAFDEPAAPRVRNDAIPVELETIVLKAMAKDPDCRYASARELADDLRRFLDDKPILARRPTLLDRARQWIARHNQLVAAAGAVMLLANVALAAAVFWTWQEKKQTDSALRRVERELEALRNNTGTQAYGQRHQARHNGPTGKSAGSDDDHGREVTADSTRAARW